MEAEGNVKKVTRILCAAALGVFVCTSLYAQEALPAQTPVPAVDETTLAIGDAPAGTSGGTSTSVLPYILRMVLVLGLILALIYGLYVVLRRSVRPPVVEDQYLRVLASTQLAPGRSVHVASIGKRAWVLGSTDSSVSLIAELDDRELIDTLELKALSSPQTQRRAFSDTLAQWLKPKKGVSGQASETKDFFSRQRDRLKKF